MQFSHAVRKKYCVLSNSVYDQNMVTLNDKSFSYNVRGWITLYNEAPIVQRIFFSTGTYNQVKLSS